jgi:Ser/Thr protein kinase RdoA (MazF antagonist)
MPFEEILAQYDLGSVTGTDTLGGTAGATLRVHAAKGAFVLRRRGLRTSGIRRVAFDSRIRRSLQAEGLPLVAPIPTTSGADGISTDEGLWELTPYIAGREHRHGNRRELASLAHILAAFHRAGSRISATADPPPPHRQFALAVPGSPESTRIDDPAAMRAALQIVLPGLDEPARATAHRMLGLLESIVAHYDGASYSAIDGHLVHGDLHPANILFDAEGRVAGLFDLDWASFAPRVRDLADLVWFFAGAPLIGGHDIWALTGARRTNRTLARHLLGEYNASFPLAPGELEALPWAWLARWIAIHIEGMYKVPPDQRGRFLTRDMGEPVEEMLSTGFTRLLG